MWSYLKQLFRRRPGPNADINEMIQAVADHQREEDRQRTYRMLYMTDLYFPVRQLAGKPIAVGEQFKSGKKGRRMSLFTAEVQGLNMAIFYTNPADIQGEADDSAGIATLRGREAFLMILNAKGVDGLIVQNNRGSYLGLSTELAGAVCDALG